MSVGRIISKGEIDVQIGDWASMFQKQLQRITTLKGFFDSQTDDQLVALGYIATEVPIIRAGINDGWQHAQITIGQAALASPQDFRQYISQFWGVGNY